MTSIEDEIKRTRKKLSRSLLFLGIITLGAILYALLNKNPSHGGLLADISNNVQPDLAATAPSITPPTPPSEAAAPTATTTDISSAPTPIATASSDAPTSTVLTPTPDTIAATSTPLVNASSTTTGRQTATTSEALVSASTTASGTTNEALPITPQASSSQSSPQPSAQPSTPPSPKTLPYLASTFAPGDGWQNWWGDAGEASGMLTIGAGTSTAGGGALLAGADAWGNYTFQAKLTWIKGYSFGLLARYELGDNYVACEFNEPSPGNVAIYLDEYIGGKGITLASTEAPDNHQATGPDITASIAVHGNQGTCTYNGTSVSTASTGQAITLQNDVGGIGFTTWDPNTNNSEIAVTSVNVVAD